MIELNLFKNYKLSLAEAHKAYVADTEVFVTDYKPIAAKSSWTKKFLLTFLTATFVFALIATIVIIVINPFSKPPVVTQPVEDALPQAPPPAGDPKSDYVRIQIIEFTDTTAPEAPSTARRNTTPDIEVLPSLAPAPVKQPTSAPQAATPKTETVPASPPAKKETKPAPPAPAAAQAIVPAVSLYSLQLDDATPAEYELLKNLAAEYNTKVTLTGSNYRSTPVWTVYIPKNGSGIFIENIEVAPEAAFSARSEAVRFAQKYGYGTVIIKMEENTELCHNVEVCCMPMEEAKTYAQKSGITDKIFKLKKK